MRRPPEADTDAYVRDLDRRLQLPWLARRRLVSEVRGHIEDASRHQPDSEVFDRLGSPWEIAAVANAGGFLGNEMAADRPALVSSRSVDAQVRCGGAIHTIVWRSGALAFRSHASSAPYGSRCWEVLEAWRMPPDDAIDLVPVWLDPDHLEARPAARSSRPLRPPYESFLRRLGLQEAMRSETRWSRAVISSLPLELRRRFCAGVLRGLERSAFGAAPAADVQRSALDAVARKAVRGVLRRQLSAVARRVHVAVELAPPSESWEVDGGVDASGGADLRVRVPSRWLHQVWASGEPLYGGVLALGPSEGLWWQRGREGWWPVLAELGLESG